MALLPISTAISELNVGRDEKITLAEEAAALRDGSSEGGLTSITRAPAGCVIKDVAFYEGDDGCRIVIHGEESGLEVVTSFATREMRVSAT